MIVIITLIVIVTCSWLIYVPFLIVYSIQIYGFGQIPTKLYKFYMKFHVELDTMFYFDDCLHGIHTIPCGILRTSTQKVTWFFILVTTWSDAVRNPWNSMHSTLVHVKDMGDSKLLWDKKDQSLCKSFFEHFECQLMFFGPFKSSVFPCKFVEWVCQASIMSDELLVKVSES